MNYSLAKQLKDAGFPQGGEDSKGGIIHAEGCDWGAAPCAQPYSPTLEELIEACGDKLLVLKHVPSSYSRDLESLPHYWYVGGGEDRGNYFSYQMSGSTPTETVARLWLALNPKK